MPICAAARPYATADWAAKPSVHPHRSAVSQHPSLTYCIQPRPLTRRPRLNERLPAGGDSRPVRSLRAETFRLSEGLVYHQADTRGARPLSRPNVQLRLE